MSADMRRRQRSASSASLMDAGDRRRGRRRRHLPEPLVEAIAARQRRPGRARYRGPYAVRYGAPAFRPTSQPRCRRSWPRPEAHEKGGSDVGGDDGRRAGRPRRGWGLTRPGGSRRSWRTWPGRARRSRPSARGRGDGRGWRRRGPGGRGVGAETAGMCRPDDIGPAGARALAAGRGGLRRSPGSLVARARWLGGLGEAERAGCLAAAAPGRPQASRAACSPVAGRRGWPRAGGATRSLRHARHGIKQDRRTGAPGGRVGEILPRPGAPARVAGRAARALAGEARHRQDSKTNLNEVGLT